MSILAERPLAEGSTLEQGEQISLRGWLVIGGCFVSTLIGPGLVASTFNIFFATLLVGPPVAGAMRDATSTYFPVLILFAAAALCAALLVGFIGDERLTVSNC